MSDINEIRKALNDAGVEYAEISGWDVRLIGEMKDIVTARRAFDALARLSTVERDLHHWRQECGKLHSQLAKLRDEITAERAEYLKGEAAWRREIEEARKNGPALTGREARRR